jgi:hypothetical protein
MFISWQDLFIVTLGQSVLVLVLQTISALWIHWYISVLCRQRFCFLWGESKLKSICSNQILVLYRTLRKISSCFTNSTRLETTCILL